MSVEPRWARPLDLAAKALFVACCLWIWLHLGDPQYAGKGFDSRLIGYPIGVLLVPIGWWIAQVRAKRKIAFPWLADATHATASAKNHFQPTASFRDSVGARSPPCRQGGRA